MGNRFGHTFKLSVVKAIMGGGGGVCPNFHNMDQCYTNRCSALLLQVKQFITVTHYEESFEFQPCNQRMVSIMQKLLNYRIFKNSSKKPNQNAMVNF